MNKRTLSKVEIKEANTELLNLAHSTDKCWCITADLVDANILVLHFFAVKELKLNNKNPEFRTFFSREELDFINQDLTSEKIKWKQFSYSHQYSSNLTYYQSGVHPDEHGYYHGFEALNAAAVPEDEKTIQIYFEGYEDSDHLIWKTILLFQQKVLECRLHEKHRKVTDKIDKLMKPVQDPPQEFFDWIQDTGMQFSRYFIYESNNKSNCVCTHCGKVDIVDRKKIRMRNNEKGTCPFCGSPVTFKAKGRMPYRIKDERYFLYIDPTQEGFIARFFHGFRDIEGKGYNVENYVHEVRRIFYAFKENNTERTSYDWGLYKQQGVPRWCPDIYNFQYSIHSALFPGNLPDAWQHTWLRYSGLEYLSLNDPVVCDFEKAFNVYKEIPHLEWICKMGLSKIALEIIREPWTAGRKINLNGKTIYEILKINKLNTKLLQKVNGGMPILRLLRASEEIGLAFKEDELIEYYNLFNSNAMLLKNYLHCSVGKIIRYIKKESKNYPGKVKCEDIAGDWFDYITWCKALGYDLDNMFYYLPKNFKAVHDRTQMEYQALLNKQAAEKKAKRDKEAKIRMLETKKALEKIFAEDGNAFKVKGKGLVLLVPENVEQLKNEGERLHHCVATYADKVAEGKTMILFVRKAEKPDVPYFTMEFKDDHIVQCRGDHNCCMPADVKEFVTAFEDRIKKMINKGDQNDSEGILAEYKVNGHKNPAA